MQTFRIIQNGDDYLLPVYNRQKIVLMRGDGSYIYDSERMVYLDFFQVLPLTAWARPFRRW